MIKLFNNIVALAALGTAAIAMPSCSDDWSNHYEPSVEGEGKTIYEEIASRPELSTFKSMIDKAGYADLLNSSQTFTVWAPVNSALAGIDLNDEALVERTVVNHIARFSNSTAAAGSGVRMFNGKKFTFDGSMFGGVVIADADNLCNNGVLHLMNDFIPYAFNIREFIDNDRSTSRLAEFLSRFDEEIFDVVNSTPIDVNENGETVYDSLKTDYNRVLDYPLLGLGPIANEDSTFTMVVPTDAAWLEAYEQIKPWFVTANDSITDVQTSLAIFENLIFRRNITDPATLPAGLESTSGSEFADPSSLFEGTTWNLASNGAIWIAGKLNQNPLETWNPPLNIEGETAMTRKMLDRRDNCLTIDVAVDNQFADMISKMSYIHVTSSVLDNPGVEFTINNPLSGKYAIYAYFVPAIADNPTATSEVTRLQFSVKHPQSATSSRTRTVNFKSDDYLTSASEITEMYVGEITFPASHFVDRLRLMDESYDATLDESNFKITVQTNVSQSEFNAGTLKREFRIDRIVLVPVIQ